MKAELTLVNERFPGLDSEIESLFQKSQDFRSLCHDYFLCNKSLEQWQTNTKKHEELIQECLELKKAIESELLHYINDVKADN